MIAKLKEALQHVTNDKTGPHRTDNTTKDGTCTQKGKKRKEKVQFFFFRLCPLSRSSAAVSSSFSPLAENVFVNRGPTWGRSSKQRPVFLRAEKWVLIFLEGK
ncbi:hypothetical protein CDAR_62611 [Caerostris darwini]|uniref:Uncharacterized protein n=1 Tax=Caerostris darwini TaxID=1538125 RepID=A0AAV4UFC4_9ARAC|nr:hypothetical protein CDAR_62611 [Caerostris darwini]